MNGRSRCGLPSAAAYRGGAARLRFRREERGHEVVLKPPRLARASSAGTSASSISSRNVCCGFSEEATKCRGADAFSVRRFHADRPAALDEDSLGRRAQRGSRRRTLAHRGLQRAGQRGRPADRHLRLGRAREQGGDVVAEPAHPQVDLAQAVEEEQPGPDRRVLELALHELQRREPADLEQQPPLGRPLQQRPPPLRRQRAATSPRARGSSRTMGTKSSCHRRSAAASRSLSRANDAASARSPSTTPASGRPAGSGRRSAPARCTARRAARAPGRGTTASA